MSPKLRSSLPFVASRSVFVASMSSSRRPLRGYRPDFSSLSFCTCPSSPKASVGGLLLLADRFRAALGLRQLRLRQAHSLRGHFHLPLQIRDSRICLVQLRGQDLVLIPAASPGLRSCASPWYNPTKPSTASAAITTPNSTEIHRGRPVIRSRTIPAASVCLENAHLLPPLNSCHPCQCC